VTVHRASVIACSRTTSAHACRPFWLQDSEAYVPWLAARDFRLWKRQLSKTCSVLACAMPTCMLLSSCRPYILHHLSSNNKEQSQADSLTYLIERAAVRHLPHWLCLLAATCAPPGVAEAAPQIPVISMHNYWPSRRVPDITRPLALPVGCSLNVRCSPACYVVVAVSSAWHRRRIQCI
jgi:hypothetical protein